MDQRRLNRQVRAWALLAALGCTLPQARAEGLAVEGRTWFQLGGFVPRIDTRFQADAFLSSAQGSGVDGEDDLGLRRRQSALAASFGRRIGQNWHFGLDYLQTRRSAERTLPRAINVAGIGLAAGTRVQSSLELKFMGLYGGVALVNTGATQFGLTAGGFILRSNLDVQGATLTRSSHRGLELMPLVGLFFNTELSPAWRLEGQLQQGQASGSKLTQATLDLSWRASTQWRLGAGLRAMKGRSKDDRNDWFNLSDTRIDFELAGPQLFARLAF